MFFCLFSLRVSSDFHYIYERQKIEKDEFSNTTHLNFENLPISPIDDKISVVLELYDINIQNDANALGGSQMIMYNVDEYPFENKNRFVFRDMTNTDIMITPTVILADGSIDTMKPEE